MSSSENYCTTLFTDIVPYTACTVVGVLVFRELLSKIRTYRNESFWKSRGIERRKARDNIPHKILNQCTSAVLPPFGDAHQLILDVVSKKITYQTAVVGCIQQTRKIGKEKLNAVTEEFYDEAVETAKQFDAGNFEDLESKVLLGVPISIKDCIDQRGADSTCGTSVRSFQQKDEDGLQVSLLRKSGAIPFVRSNVPQLLMMPESENGVWGVTNNPYDPSRTPGGSSGGEGALVASGCSVMGLGSDIGGSIRIPAHYCGVVGFKPTPALLTKNGSAVPRLNSRNGQAIIAPTVGPLARSVRDCALMMEVLASPTARKSDPSVPPIEWRTDVVLTGALRSSPPDLRAPRRHLRIAVMRSDNFFEPVPACRRAVEEAASALASKGHIIVPFELPVDGNKLVSTYISLMSADGNWYSYLRALEGEELYSSYKTLQVYTEIPNCVRPAICWAMRMIGEHRKAELLEITRSGGLDVRQYWEVIADMKEIQNAYLEAFYRNGYDALLMPGLGITAPPHGMAPDLLMALSYSFLANLLHWPAGTVPVTHVATGEDTYPLTELPTKQRDSVAKLAAKSVEGSVGLPVGVQVMTPMWEDERCLYIMREIEDAVKFKSTLPGFQ